MKWTDWLTLGLIGVYFILCVGSLSEGEYMKALYWLGAALLSVAILRMHG